MLSEPRKAINFYNNILAGENPLITSANEEGWTGDLSKADAKTITDALEAREIKRVRNLYDNAVIIKSKADVAREQAAEQKRLKDIQERNAKKDGKVTSIEVINFREHASKGYETINGKITDESSDQFLIDLSGDNSRLEIVHRDAIDEYVLENTYVGPKGEPNATGKDAINIYEYYLAAGRNLLDDGGGDGLDNEEQLESWARDKALEPTRKKLEVATYPYNYFRLDGKKPVKFSNKDMDRLNTNEGRLNFARTYAFSETSAQQGELSLDMQVAKLKDKQEAGTISASELTRLQYLQQQL